MLYQNGNTLGNNGFLSAGQIAAAKTIKVGDRVRLSESYRQTLRDCKLYRADRDEAAGTVTRGGLPNGVFEIGFDDQGGYRRLVHVDHLETVPYHEDPANLDRT